jgi:hypothetical protein
MLNTVILHLTGSCPKIAIVSDFPGNIYIPKSIVIFCNVNTPLCKLSSESHIMNGLSAKRSVYLCSDS